MEDAKYAGGCEGKTCPKHFSRRVLVGDLKLETKTENQRTV